MTRHSLSPEAVKRILKSLPPESKVFLVGGQALNVWADRYANAPGIADFGPFASKDIDYYGSAKAAEKLRAALDGHIDIPAAEDHSPEAARVRATLGVEDISIDFMASLKGVDLAIAERRYVKLEFEATDGDTLSINVCHPLDAFRSRVANVIALGRRNDHSLRQLGASVLVLGAYIDHLLTEKRPKGATDALKEVHDFLRSSIEARGVRALSPVDPIAILQRFATDERLDERYRSVTLARMIARLEGLS